MVLFTLIFIIYCKLYYYAFQGITIFIVQKRQTVYRLSSCCDPLLMSKFREPCRSRHQGEERTDEFSLFIKRII